MYRCGYCGKEVNPFHDDIVRKYSPFSNEVWYHGACWRAQNEIRKRDKVRGMAERSDYERLQRERRRQEIVCGRG